MARTETDANQTPARRLILALATSGGGCVSIAAAAQEEETRCVRRRKVGRLRVLPTAIPIFPESGFRICANTGPPAVAAVRPKAPFQPWAAAKIKAMTLPNSNSHVLGELFAARRPGMCSVEPLSHHS